jgi:hypothetical protein
MAYIKPTDRKKPWAIRNKTDKRQIRDLSIRNLFRIFCEGESTEPEYFKSFPVNTETKVEAIGLARSRKSLVKKAISLLSKEEMLLGMSNFDSDRQLWVVFDYDIKGAAGESKDYNDAIELAEKNGIRVAYSNDSVELWFVLHYKYHTASVTRNEYYEYLSSKLNLNYEKEGKSKEFSQSLYHILLPFQTIALQNAERLYNAQCEENYCDQNPCTTVHKLVIELNKCLKK